MKLPRPCPALLLALLLAPCATKADPAAAPPSTPAAIENSTDTSAASAQIRGNIRAAAQRYAEILAERKESAHELVKRVEAILTLPANIKPADDIRTDGRMALLKQLSMPRGNLTFGFGWDGYTGLNFHFTQEGMVLALRELQPRLVRTPDDLSLLELAAATADKIPDEALATKYNDQAVALARQQVAAHPNEAEAHAWLAQCLGWRKGTHPETIKEINRALELDSKNWRAQIVLANGWAERMFYELLPSGAPPLGQAMSHEDAQKSLKELYDHPPAAANIAALQNRIDSTIALLQQAADNAGDNPLPRIALVDIQLSALYYLDLARSLRQHPAEPFEEFSANLSTARSARLYHGLFAQADEIANLTKSDSTDPDAIAASVLLPLIAAMSKSSPDAFQPLPPEWMEKFANARSLLEPLANSADPIVAAKANEAIAFLAFFQHTNQKGTGKKKFGYSAELAEHAGRAVTLNPERVLALDLLFAEAESIEDFPAGAAAMEIRRAVIDDVPSLMNAAAAEAYLGHWKTSRELLTSALRNDPNNVDAWLGVIAVSLRENPDKEKLAAAGKMLAQIAQKEIKTVDAGMFPFEASVAPLKLTLSEEQSKNTIVDIIVWLALSDRVTAARSLVEKAFPPGKADDTRKSLLEALDKAQPPS